MLAVLDAPRWSKVVTIREECRLTSLQNCIIARTAVATATYVRCWPDKPLSKQLLHALQRPPTDAPTRDWIHAAADAARSLGVADEV